MLHLKEQVRDGDEIGQERGINKGISKKVFTIDFSPLSISTCCACTIGSIACYSMVGDRTRQFLCFVNFPGLIATLKEERLGLGPQCEWRDLPLHTTIPNLSLCVWSLKETKSKNFSREALTSYLV